MSDSVQLAVQLASLTQIVAWEGDANITWGQDFSNPSLGASNQEGNF